MGKRLSCAGRSCVLWLRCGRCAVPRVRSARNVADISGVPSWALGSRARSRGAGFSRFRPCLSSVRAARLLEITGETTGSSRRAGARALMSRRGNIPRNWRRLFLAREMCAQKCVRRWMDAPLKTEPHRETSTPYWVASEIVRLVSPDKNMSSAFL